MLRFIERSFDFCDQPISGASPAPAVWTRLMRVISLQTRTSVLLKAISDLLKLKCLQPENFRETTSPKTRLVSTKGLACDPFLAHKQKRNPGITQTCAALEFSKHFYAHELICEMTRSTNLLRENKIALCRYKPPPTLLIFFFSQNLGHDSVS